MGGSYRAQDQSFGRVPAGATDRNPNAIRPSFPSPPGGPPQFRIGGQDPRFSGAGPMVDPRFGGSGLGMPQPQTSMPQIAPPMAAPMAAPMPMQPGVYTPGSGFYDAPLRPGPMQGPMQAGNPQGALQNAMAGGGATIQDILQRVMMNQRLMQGVR